LFLISLEDFLLDVKNNQEAFVANHLENNIGRKPTSLQAGLKLYLIF
jgi:hypothetical protein